MEIDVVFQSDSSVYDAEFTENDSTFNCSYDKRMTLMGADGKSAYQIAVENGFDGTETEWLENLKGKNGKDGYTPKKGVDYYTDEERQAFADEVLGSFTVDAELSEVSTNAVQNRAVASKFADVETTIGNIDSLLGTI